MNLFGKKKEEPAAPRIKESIMLLKQAQETLEKRRTHLEKQVASAIDDAKARMKSGDKRGAMFQLKRKKMFDKEIEGTFGKLSNLEMQVLALERAMTSNDILRAMTAGSEALKATIQQTDLNRIDEVMDDINESIGMVDEVSDAMGQQIGPVIDEDELEKELGDLEAELAEEALVGLKQPVQVPTRKQQQPELDLSNAPSVPSKQLVAPVAAAASSSKQKKEEDELADLEASLA